MIIFENSGFIDLEIKATKTLQAKIEVGEQSRPAQNMSKVRQCTLNFHYYNKLTVMYHVQDATK